MSLCSLALLALLGAGQSAAEQIIDDFQYPAQATARQAWTAAEGTPPVELKADGLVLKAPFAAKPNLSRVVIDRHARLDLAMPGEFVLQAASDAPEAFGNITLYFHSGRGWYAAHASLGRKGTQTLHFSKGSFTTEDSPAGWDQIDGIRIAAWHGKAEDAAPRFVRLAAMSHDVALVIPGKASKDDSERRTATETAHRVTDMLTELGLGADALDDTAVARGRWAIAVSPSWPTTSTCRTPRTPRWCASSRRAARCWCATRCRRGSALPWDLATRSMCGGDPANLPKSDLMLRSRAYPPSCSRPRGTSPSPSRQGTTPA